MKLNLNARLVAAICEFKAKNDIRYYLNGIYVEPLPSGGAVIVATNGHAMGVWRDPSAVVERTAILRIGKLLREACKEADEARLELIDGRLAVTTKQNTEYHVQPNAEKGEVIPWEIQGTYPDWKTVIPDECQTGSMGMFSAGYVKLVHKALKIATGNEFVGVTLRQSDEKKSIFVSCGFLPDFAAIIMPMRDDSENSYPAWLSDFKAPAKAAEPPPVKAPDDAALVGVLGGEVMA